MPAAAIETDPKALGRPPKLTSELAESLRKYIVMGNDIVVACRAVGISKSSLYSWMEQAKKPGAKKLHRDFLDMIDKATAQAEVRSVEVLARAEGKGSVAAAQFKLARRYPSRWGASAVDPTIAGGTGGPGGGASAPDAKGGGGGFMVYRPAKDSQPDDEELPGE
jgi:transposase-like protein